MNNNITSPEYVREKALEYLEANYNDTFTVVAYSDGGWAYDYSSINFTSEKYPDSDIEVRAYKNNKKLSFIDNYYHSSMKEEAISFFESLLDQQDAYVLVRFLGYIWSDELNGASSFSQWQESGNCRIDVFIITNEVLSEESQTAYLNNVIANQTTGTIAFLTTNDSNLLRDYQLSDIIDNFGASITSEAKYNINSRFEITKY